jgi:hypothetical protein
VPRGKLLYGANPEGLLLPLAFVLVSHASLTGITSGAIALVGLILIEVAAVAALLGAIKGARVEVQVMLIGQEEQAAGLSHPPEKALQCLKAHMPLTIKHGSGEAGLEAHILGSLIESGGRAREGKREKKEIVFVGVQHTKIIARIAYNCNGQMYTSTR